MSFAGVYAGSAVGISRLIHPLDCRQRYSSKSIREFWVNDARQNAPPLPVEAKIGEGGMGIVYRAFDTHLDRPLAIKVLPPVRMADPERKRRFVQEAKAASALNHPNIVTVYDVDNIDGVDFMAMEFIDGQTLDHRIGTRGMRLNLVLKYAIQVADALMRAHGAGIVHRDLKPGNVMVDTHEQVKVLDFGLAKLSEKVRRGESETTLTEQPKTDEGTIVGTVSYMSPEQAEGKPVDARSDIFSFGSMLYEMVTGARDFNPVGQKHP